MIKGIHHISMKCRESELEEVLHFYIDILGMTIKRKWSAGVMIDTGAGLLEVFSTGDGESGKGSLRHIAFAVDSVDEIISRVKESGYEVFVEPTDKVIDSTPAFPFRMAFCYGPLGEEVEFFEEK